MFKFKFFNKKLNPTIELLGVEHGDGVEDFYSFKIIYKNNHYFNFRMYSVFPPEVIMNSIEENILNRIDVVYNTDCATKIYFMLRTLYYNAEMTYISTDHIQC